MSADNQIVIIKLRGKYYVDHIMGDFDASTPEEKFDLSNPIDTETEALEEARRMEKEYGYVEYGISRIFEIKKD